MRQTFVENYFINSKESVVNSRRILYTPSPFAKSSLLYLQEIGSLVANKPHVSRRSNLQSYLFFIVTAGSGQLVYNGMVHPLRVGDCVFINCDQPYEHATSADDLWQLSWIHFDGAMIAAIYEKYVLRGGQPVFHPADLEPFMDMHASLFHMAASQDYIRDMRINSDLNALLTLIMAESWNPAEAEGKKQKRSMLPVKQYLDEHYREKIVLDELAASFYINKFYMTRIFKEQFGVSINTYLQQIRITQAKQLLWFTDQTVDEIGLLCGIGEPNYFSRVFRQVEGVAPSEYRRRWRNKS
jgi:AraC-like DNA-binding protein